MGDAGRQLFQAVSDKDIKVIDIVLRQQPLPPELFEHKNNSGHNSLMMAVQLVPEEDAVTFTAFILSVKEPTVPIDATNKFGQTALMLTAKRGKSNLNHSYDCVIFIVF